MIIGESPAPWHVGCGKIKSRARVRSPCGPMPITGQRGLAPPGTWLEPAFDLERLGLAHLSGCRLLCFSALFSNINTALMLPQAPFPFQIPLLPCTHGATLGQAAISPKTLSISTPLSASCRTPPILGESLATLGAACRARPRPAARPAAA